MTQQTRIALHILSLALMVTTIFGLQHIDQEFANRVFWVIGSFAFGMGWKRATDYLMDKYETNT